jgi:hypothetical protein
MASYLEAVFDSRLYRTLRLMEIAALFLINFLRKGIAIEKIIEYDMPTFIDNFG